MAVSDLSLKIVVYYHSTVSCLDTPTEGVIRRRPDTETGEMVKSRSWVPFNYESHGLYVHDYRIT